MSSIDPQRVMGLCPVCLLDDIAEQVVGVHGVQRCPTIKQLNEQIKGFQIVELLGKGGAAWTFLAVQESLSREVAVKVMYRNSNWKDSSARFQREAESLAKLNHPRIVTIHDFGSTEDFHYLIMEFVPGPTLRRRINTLRPNVQQSLNIASQICEAVQYAHDAGILHRDIKPENILFTSEARDAQVKVADFGIAQIFCVCDRRRLVRIAMRPIAHRELSSTVRILSLQSQCRCCCFKSLTKPTRKKNRRSKIIGQSTKPKPFLVTLGCSNIGLFDGAFGCRLVGLFQQPKFNFGSDRPGNSNNESS